MINPFITKKDLITHLYPEIVKEITRDYSTSFANLAAFPASGQTGRKYIAIDTNKVYLWNGDNAFEETQAMDIAQLAIDQSIGEVKSYLNRYDIEKMLSDDDTIRTFKDEFFNSKVKDIVCWNLVKLANPNINIDLFRTSYEDAIKYFKDVMRGNVDPVWPLRIDDPSTALDESGHIASSSNIKRRNHY